MIIDYLYFPQSFIAGWFLLGILQKKIKILGNAPPQQEAAAKQKITGFADDIDRVVESIARHGITLDQAQDIYKGMDTLGKYLRKAGFTRIKNG